MYITADDIKHEVSIYYLIDNRNANKSRPNSRLLHLQFL